MSSLEQQELLLRHLTDADAEPLGQFFDGLSATIRSYYAPHRLNREFAKNLCGALAQDPQLRWVLSTANGQILGYFLVELSLRPSEIERYLGYGVDLSRHRACSYAPVLADNAGGRGLGSLVFKQIKQQLANRRITLITLLGGVQCRNAQAVHYYRKQGFVDVGRYHTEFENMDMCLELKGRCEQVQ